MSFGLRKAVQSFQRFMDKVLRSLDFCLSNKDDILVVLVSEAHHLEHLRIIFEWLRKYSIVINPNKNVFGQHQVKFLG